MYADYYQPPPVMRDVSRTPQIHSEMRPIILPEEDDDNGEVNVVDVLRILTALEERLGSLGPKIIDLLAQALALEKKEANSSDTLLDSDINCVLFETIKEKLKGQLLTGLVDMVQERAFKKAIKKIASLIYLASERKRKRDKIIPKIKPVSVPGIGTVDRAAIAKQIANALIAQGKTDVTQAELEQLINAVVGMAEASKGTNKPMTTANFLQNLTGVGAFASSQSTKVQNEKSSPNKIEDLDKLVEPLTPSPGKNSSKDMENLSDADLQTLLQNFKDLSTEEQHSLINYLKKLEYQEPERVEKLRGFVNLETGSKTKDDGPDRKVSSGRESPFYNRQGSVNPASDDLVQIESEEEIDNKQDDDLEINEEKPKIDSEDEDYTFEDVVKTASMNVKDKEKEIDMKIEEDKKKKKELDLANAKDLISNLMSSITKTNDTSKGIDLLGLGTSDSARSTSVSIQEIPVSTAEFAKTLSSISIDNLANIVSTVKNMTADNADKITPQQIEKNTSFETLTNRLNFDPAHLDKPIYDGMDPRKTDLLYDRSFAPRDQTGFDRSLGPEPPFRNSAPGPELSLRRGPDPLFRDDGLTSRDDSIPFRDDGLPFRNDGLSFRNDGPSFRDDGPSFRDDGPSFQDDDHSFRDEGLSFRDDGQLFRDSNPPFRSDGLTFDRGGSMSRMPLSRGPSSMSVAPNPYSSRDGLPPRGPSPNFRSPPFSMRDRPTTFQNRPPFSNFQSQLSQYNMRGPRLNLMDKNRPGNSNDFNNRSNYSRW